MFTHSFELGLLPVIRQCCATIPFNSVLVTYRVLNVLAHMPLVQMYTCISRAQQHVESVCGRPKCVMARIPHITVKPKNRNVFHFFMYCNNRILSRILISLHFIVPWFISLF